MIGKLTKVPLRELWKKEDKDFSKWLEENIDYLNEIIDIDITVESREEKVGPFRVDLYGKDNFGNKVIIENQLGKTDHDHLGKVITYLTNLGAGIAIWITSKPIDEHIKALEWLNETTPNNISFYLIKIEAVRIGDQTIAAPLFTIVSSPSNEAKAIGASKKESAQNDELFKEFWTKLLEKSKEKTDLYANISPNKYQWIATGAGKAGIGYNLVITNRYGSCEIYLDRGKEFEEPNINKIRFDKLIKHKDEIENKYGGKLNWERLDNRRASRISVKFEGIGLQNKDKWDELQDKMIDTMIKIESVFREYIPNLD
ncbi:MAG: DUF4268 domain-containing protein [Patescibacteria group bacterium]